MNAFLGKLKRTSEYIAMILFFVASFFVMLYYIGNFGADFMPVIGNLLSMLLDVAIWMIVPVCIAMRKRCLAKSAAVGVSGYWLISSLFDLLDSTSLARSVYDDISIAIGVFSFLSACALIVMTIFFVLSMVNKNKDQKFIALCIFLGTLLFYLVLFSLSTASAADVGANWNAYFMLIYKYLVIPFAILFIGFAFAFKEEELVLNIKPKAKKVKATQEQAPVAEEADSEAVLEEAPAAVAAEPAPAEKKAEAPAKKKTSAKGAAKEPTAEEAPAEAAPEKSE